MSAMTLMGATLVGGLAAGCGGTVTGLPDVPATITAREAGLEALPQLAEEAKRIEMPSAAAVGDPLQGTPSRPVDDPIERVRLALESIDHGAGAEGLTSLSEALRASPSDLVIGNAFRMTVYRLNRAAREAAAARGEHTVVLPEYLRGEPLATLERLAVATAKPSREIRLQIALGHVDRMVLEPALEIRAPESIESVRHLTDLLRDEPYYVPALVARGLNHLNRPRHLVWPEHPGPAPDAASADLARAAAVGRRVGAAPRRVEATVLVLLGDAYAHEERPGLARSWWAFARGRAGGREESRALDDRLSWPDSNLSDRIEQRLEERMADTDHPVSDLSFLWSDARGPL